MRKDLKLKSADCGWRSAVSTGPTGGTVASGHAHHWDGSLRLARVNCSAVFFTLLDSARSLHTLTTPLSLSTAPAAPGRSLKFTLICGLPATR